MDISRLILMLPVAALGVSFLSPEFALAGNKFETIGGGVAGSSGEKLEFMRMFGLGFGSFFLLAAIVSLTGGHSNALMLNYSLWKQSSIVLLTLSALSFTGAFLL